jgi:DNA-binding CsgD family transcriptional regulator
MNAITQSAGRAGLPDLMPGPILPQSPALSKRQREILRAASVGASDKTIAGQLGISPRTLEGHWRAIHRKLGSLNRCQAGFIFAAMRESPRVNALM